MMRNSVFYRPLPLLLFVLVAFVFPSTSFGLGRETGAQADDFDVQVNSKWAGGYVGGYYPIRIQVKNNGPSRQLTFQFGDRDQSPAEEVPVVRRSVLCENEKTTSLTLLVPMVGQAMNGTLFAMDQSGARIEGLSFSLQLPDLDRMGTTVAMLVISSISPSQQAFKEVMQNKSLQADVETVRPQSLPTSWLAYTGLDIVAINVKTFIDLSEPARQAIIRWGQSGGHLVIQEFDPQDIEKLDEILSLNKRFATRTSVTRSMRFPIVEVSLGRVFMVPVRSNRRSSQRATWEGILSGIGDQRVKWSNRNGFIARNGHKQFAEFLIPGVKSVPIYSFLTLITLFTLLIGPVNYFFLWRKRQLNLLLVTIPLLACVTSVTLFGYSAVQHGFGVKSRVRSLTILDQGTDDAVTFARTAIFAGINPSLSLSFSHNTAVFPVWPTEQSYEQGETDWTDTQLMQNGWLRARTRTQFMTINQRTERGRLSIEKDGSKVTVANGLEWGVKSLIVFDKNSDVFSALEIPAGGEASLNSRDVDEAAQLEDLRVFRELMQEFLVEKVEEQKNTIPAEVWEMKARRRRWGRNQIRAADVDFATSLMEQEMSQYEVLSSSMVGRPGTYVAVLESNPGVDLGIEGTDEQNGIHVLIGYYSNVD